MGGLQITENAALNGPRTGRLRKRRLELEGLRKRLLELDGQLMLVGTVSAQLLSEEICGRTLWNEYRACPTSFLKFFVSPGSGERR